jgi:hypothetical protein
VKNYITDKHRLFYINDVMEFALFYDSKVIDKKLILDTFLESKNWKFYCQTYEVKRILKSKVSDDLKRVDITTK